MNEPTAAVVGRLVAELAEQPVSDDDRLEDVLDSLQIEQLISALEAAYGLEFDDNDLVTENFEDIATLAAFVDSRCALKA